VIFVEKRSNIIEKLEAFSEKEILSYAIASERELELFYRDLSKDKGQLIAEFLETVANDEKAHWEVLLGIYREKFGEETLQLVEGVSSVHASLSTETCENLVDALRIVLENEENTYRIYNYLSKKAPEHRDVFEYLATQEAGHIEALKMYKDYFEAQLGGNEISKTPITAQLFSNPEQYYKPRTKPY
jgi:rubrerythrin